MNATRRTILGAIAIAPAAIAVLAAAAPHSQFELLLREYQAVHQMCETWPGSEDDPTIRAQYGRLSEIERTFVQDPCRSTADAKAKLRFMIDLGTLGIALDGDDAHAVVQDAAGYLL